MLNPPIPWGKVIAQIPWGKVTAQTVEFACDATIFAQGEPATTVLYIQQGTVRLTVVSHTGREAVIAVLAPGQFFGEGCLAGQRVRTCTAIAMSTCTIRTIRQQDVTDRLHSRRSFADAFLAHMLKRNVRIEADLVDQLFNSTEKRLARTLLLLARYGDPEGTRKIVPKVSQELLAEMVGTTRTRVNFFMNKFKKLGFIRYDNGICVQNSLLSVILRE